MTRGPITVVEPLESRLLFSGGTARLVGSELRVLGVGGRDNLIVVEVDVPAAGGAAAGAADADPVVRYRVTLNGTELPIKGAAKIAGGSSEPKSTAANSIRVTGGRRDDVVRLGAGVVAAAELYGRGGDDVLAAGQGDDRLDGGPGNDVLTGGDGADHLSGSTGADTLDGGAANDVLDGGRSDDILLGGTGDDILFGDDGNDALTGGPESATDADADADTLRGGPGDDTLGGGAGADTLLGDAGNDRLLGGPGLDHLFGDGGGDRLDGGFALPDGSPPGPYDESPDDGLPDQLFGGPGGDTFVRWPADLLVDLSAADRTADP